MFTSLNATVVALWTNTVGSNVMVNDPVTGLTGAPARKPLAVKLMVSVIIAARAGAKETLNAVAHNTLAIAGLIFNFMGCHPSRRNAEATVSIPPSGYECQRLQLFLDNRGRAASTPPIA